MFQHLSLRLRILLFFALLGLGGAAMVGLGLWAGLSRFNPADPPSAFVMAGVIAGFGILALTAGIWLLFDENVAKPIERLAAALRAQAHAGTGTALNADEAKYLGDLAPAAQAVTRVLGSTMMESASVVANETARLAAEKEHLAALLSEIPTAVILVSPAHRVVLYDAQATALFSKLRLNAPLADFMPIAPVTAAWTAAQIDGQEQELDIGRPARLKPLGNGSGYLLMFDPAEGLAPDAARPLIYDFGLMEEQTSDDILNTPLDQLVCTVFDLETTGLFPAKDDIVQIGAVRLLRGRVIEAEAIDQLVNPGRPIPPASTKVHGISDGMVAGAPDAPTATAQLETFARDTILVAHNAPFDISFLRRVTPDHWDHPVLDTVLMSAVLFGASVPHTLDALCDRLGVTIPSELRHTALGDARATAEVLARMIPMAQARGLMSFGDMVAEMKKHGRLLKDMN